MGDSVPSPNPAFTPEALRLLVDVFDDAWAGVQRYDGLTDGIEMPCGARTKLSSTASASGTKTSRPKYNAAIKTAPVISVFGREEV